MTELKVGMRVKILNSKHPDQYGVVERIDNIRADTVYLVRRFEIEGYQWYDWSEIEIANRRVEQERRMIQMFSPASISSGHHLYSAPTLPDMRKQCERRGKKTLEQLRMFLSSFDIQSRPIPLSEKADSIFKFMTGDK